MTVVLYRYFSIKSIKLWHDESDVDATDEAFRLINEHILSALCADGHHSIRIPTLLKIKFIRRNLVILNQECVNLDYFTLLNLGIFKFTSRQSTILNQQSKAIQEEISNNNCQ